MSLLIRVGLFSEIICLPFVHVGGPLSKLTYDLILDPDSSLRLEFGIINDLLARVFVVFHFVVEPRGGNGGCLLTHFLLLNAFDLFLCDLFSFLLVLFSKDRL